MLKDRSEADAVSLGYQGLMSLRRWLTGVRLHSQPRVFMMPRRCSPGVFPEEPGHWHQISF